jgi:hypothetical protein
LPTVIDLESYPDFKRNFTKVYDCLDRILLQYISLIIPVLERLSKIFYSIKNNRAKIPIVLKTGNAIDWNMQTEANELSSSDIGIMPLKYTMFENGKCGFKPTIYVVYQL